MYSQVGQPVPIVFCCALACSAAMALPVSSFPNLNSLSAEDDMGGAYLHPADFLKVYIYIMYMCVYIYIYIEREREREKLLLLLVIIILKLYAGLFVSESEFALCGR